MARDALGRGLGALLEGMNVTAEAELTTLPVAQIRPNPYQPRQHFDPDRLRELADSIRQQGVIQPIVVRRDAEGFELIAGERRLRAAQLAGFEMIPALVKRADERDSLEVALLENLQREDLNPSEEARAYLRLQTTLQLRQEEVAKRVRLGTCGRPPKHQKDRDQGRKQPAFHQRLALYLSVGRIPVIFYVYCVYSSA